MKVIEKVEITNNAEKPKTGLRGAKAKMMTATDNDLETRILGFFFKGDIIEVAADPEFRIPWEELKGSTTHRESAKEGWTDGNQVKLVGPKGVAYSKDGNRREVYRVLNNQAHPPPRGATDYSGGYVVMTDSSGNPNMEEIGVDSVEVNWVLGGGSARRSHRRRGRSRKSNRIRKSNRKRRKRRSKKNTRRKKTRRR